MAEKKFSQLTAKGATIADTDLVAISESAGGGSYVSKSVTGANIKTLVTDANLTTTDITTNNVSTAKHGFVPKAPNDATQFLDGTGAFDTVKDTDLSLSDNTTNDVSAGRHGFVPKLPNNTTTFLRGDGTFATPAAGGLTNFTEAANSSAPNATVPVNSLTATGTATNIDVAIVPKGTGAFTLDIADNTATGGNKRGANAVDLQTVRSSATQVASAEGSFCVGGNNTASGIYSFTQGAFNSATQAYSVAIGYLTNSTSSYSYAIGRENTASNESYAFGWSNISSGQYSVSLGVSNTTSGSNSIALGTFGHTHGIIGRQVYASGRESATGDSQGSKFILRERTTDNTATTITTNSSTASTNNQVILSNQSAYGFTGTIVGKQSGSTNAAMWKVEGLIARGANAASTVLTTSTVTLVSNAPAWGVPTLAADTTNGGLRVQVTGATATNIQWTAVIETTEVIYA